MASFNPPEKTQKAGLFALHVAKLGRSKARMYVNPKKPHTKRDYRKVSDFSSLQTCFESKMEGESSLLAIQ